MKEVSNKIVINQAGEDRIVLTQTSGGFWYCKELNHTCKNIDMGIMYLMGEKENIHRLLNEYNSNGGEKK